MIVVSDTTPIISFLKIDRLDILEKLFGEVLIPKAVFDELTVNNEFPEESKKIRESNFLKCVFVDSNLVALVQNQTGLDLGESEAIAYTKSTNSDFLLIDEVKGRTVANGLGLKITGTIGVLLESLKKGISKKTEIQSYIKTFRDSHRHISEKLLKQLLDFSEQFD